MWERPSNQPAGNKVTGVNRVQGAQRCRTQRSAAPAYSRSDRISSYRRTCSSHCASSASYCLMSTLLCSSDATRPARGGTGGIQVPRASSYQQPCTLQEGLRPGLLGTPPPPAFKVQHRLLGPCKPWLPGMHGVLLMHNRLSCTHQTAPPPAGPPSPAPWSRPCWP